MQEILSAVHSDEVTFKDASTLIGRSLVSEFSELDSTDSVSGDDAVNVSAQRHHDFLLLVHAINNAFLHRVLVLNRICAETKQRAVSQ